MEPTASGRSRSTTPQGTSWPTRSSATPSATKHLASCKVPTAHSQSSCRPAVLARRTSTGCRHLRAPSASCFACTTPRHRYWTVRGLRPQSRRSGEALDSGLSFGLVGHSSAADFTGRFPRPQLSNGSSFWCIRSVIGHKGEVERYGAISSLPRVLAGPADASGQADIAAGHGLYPPSWAEPCRRTGTTPESPDLTCPPLLPSVSSCPERAGSPEGRPA